MKCLYQNLWRYYMPKKINICDSQLDSNTNSVHSLRAVAIQLLLATDISQTNLLFARGSCSNFSRPMYIRAPMIELPGEFHNLTKPKQTRIPIRLPLGNFTKRFSVVVIPLNIFASVNRKTPQIVPLGYFDDVPDSWLNRPCSYFFAWSGDFFEEDMGYE